jgi:hypothetical protein
MYKKNHLAGQNLCFFVQKRLYSVPETLKTILSQITATMLINPPI